jgi:hypothetical protein
MKLILSIVVMYKEHTNDLQEAHHSIAQYQPDYTLGLRCSNDDIARFLTDHISR